jgi:hypothetical protein
MRANAIASYPLRWIRPRSNPFGLRAESLNERGLLTSMPPISLTMSMKNGNRVTNT